MLKIMKIRVKSWKKHLFNCWETCSFRSVKKSIKKDWKVFLTEDAKKKLNRENQNLNLFKKINIFYKSRKELDNLCGRDETAHQGLVAEVEQLEEVTLKEFVLDNKKENINLIALEEVTDPRNIGSVIRSAVAFDIVGIIVKERSYPSKSKLLYKSASGGTEHIKIFKVSNINTALKFLKTKEFWVSSFDISAKKDFTKHNWKGKNILLFGSEGFGIKAKTLENSDFSFKVNMNNNIESLNISNTVSVVCHHIFQSIK